MWKDALMYDVMYNDCIGYIMIACVTINALHNMMIVFKHVIQWFSVVFYSH